MRDVTELNELLLGPSTYDGANQGLYDSKLDEFERMLVNNRFFFDLGFHIIAQPDPQTGLGWTRVHMLLEEEEDAARFDERRPTPEVRPGAACVSDDFGLGVNAVRQADPVEPHFTSPGIDYAPLVDEPRRRARPTTDPGDDAAAPAHGDDRHAAPGPREMARTPRRRTRPRRWTPSAMVAWPTPVAVSSTSWRWGSPCWSSGRRSSPGDAG
jgi:hypothetical protein